MWLLIGLILLAQPDLRTQNSVCKIVLTGTRGSISAGSGFVIDNTDSSAIIMTCGHVATGGGIATARFLRGVKFDLRLLFTDEDTLWDWAIYEAVGCIAPPLEFYLEPIPMEGLDVWIVGYPGNYYDGIFIYLTRATNSLVYESIYKVYNRINTEINFRWFADSVDVWGCSGSPIVTFDGKVVALLQEGWKIGYVERWYNAVGMEAALIKRIYQEWKESEKVVCGY